MSRVESEGVCLQDHQPNGVGIHATACAHKATVSDCHEAGGQDMLEEPADKSGGVELGGSWACTARFSVGEGDDTIFE